MTNQNETQEKTSSAINHYPNVKVKKMHDWKVMFGKHKGVKFIDLVQQETKYCDWIIEKFDQQTPLWRYISFYHTE